MRLGVHIGYWGTLGVSPLAYIKDGRLEQLRTIAELAAE